MKTFTRSFGAGELSPEMFGRIDDAKFQTGAAVLQNFIATPQGPAHNRPGFAYVSATKNNGVVRLVPFVYNQTQTMVLEFGQTYIRFYTHGATLLAGSAPYEIATPYLAGDLSVIHYVQNADVMTLVHPSYPPMELRRLGATNWTLTPINFGAAVATPTAVSAAASPGYKVQIASISGATITTRSNHTLALGDPIYIDGLSEVTGPVDKSGFYQVSLVPVNPTTGALIPNQLQVTDYNGLLLDTSAWGGYTLTPGTIQYGTKIYNINNAYAVSALSSTGVNQSLLSTETSALNNLNVPGSFNVITWTAVAGASRYYIFKKRSGLWGYIGEAVGTSFTDNNIAPDFTITPINLETLFAGTNDYPAAVGYVEQRRCFAGTNNQPQTLWMSNSGTESTFSYSLPSQATDRVEVKVASREVSGIQHIVPIGQLLLLTNSCEYAEYTANDGPITSTSIGIRPQSYVGASNVQPDIINNSLVYCAARGGHVREMGYAFQSGGYVTGDLSLRAAHLFDNLTLTDQTFSKAPLPIVWFVSSNGNLIGLTYVPEQQIGAWHHHVTDGVFESITCVAEDGEDRLYAVIRRNVNFGQVVRYVERMASRLVGRIDNCFFVDAGATYSGAPATIISGLTWLEGRTVAVLADGCVQNTKTVVGGSITLDQSASTVQVGLPYTADIQTLPLTLMVDGYGQGRQKNLNKVWIRVYQSSGIFAGYSQDALLEYKQRTTQPFGAPPGLQTSEVEITLPPSWNMDGQVFIRQTNPLPLTVVAVTLEVAVGG